MNASERSSLTSRTTRSSQVISLTSGGNTPRSQADYGTLLQDSGTSGRQGAEFPSEAARINGEDSAPSLNTTARNKGFIDQTTNLDCIHRCPVCHQGLADEDFSSLRQNYLKYRRNAERHLKMLEQGWDPINLTPQKSLEDAVVAATCGELFHKKCLFKYCSEVHR